MRRLGSAIWLTLSIASLGVACSLQDGGILIAEGTDGSIAKDGTVDGIGPGDSQPPDDSSTSDSGGDTDSGVDSGPPVTYACAAPLSNVLHCKTDCPITPFECPGSGLCVTNCGMCAGTGFICDACFADSGPAVARCEPSDAAALSECLPGFSRCSCADQNDCPGDNQTCNGAGCFECGEVDAGNVDNATVCKAGTGTHQCKSDGTFVKCK